VIASIVAGAMLVASLTVQAARPSDELAVAVPPSSAISAINRLADQVGVDVVVAVPLEGRRSEGLSGRFSSQTALARLLGPMELRARRLGPNLYRIEAAPPSRVRRLERSAVVPPLPALLEEVVVTGTWAPPENPGIDGAALVVPDSLTRLSQTAGATSLADLTPTVDSTRQGAGRNKLFIRGLADSAFSGPLQTTVGQYLGPHRLTYVAPDPDLALIDMEGAEVFEGPQGARFASGSIGGVIRLVPNAPTFGTVSTTLSATLAATQGGDDSGDVALVLNRPVADRSALRLVVYNREDGGFVRDEAGHRREDGVSVTGFRLAGRHEGRWDTTALVMGQRASADDSQLVSVTEATESLGPFVAQPYDSEVFLAGVSSERRFGDLVVTATGTLSRQRIRERYNATQPSERGAAVVDREQETTTSSNEFRLELMRRRWSASGGASVVVGDTRSRRLRSVLYDDAIAPWGQDKKRAFMEAAMFGEVAVRLTPALDLSAGGRVAFVESDEEIRMTGGSAVYVFGEIQDDPAIEVTPSLGIDWMTSWGFRVFARRDEAVRPGGSSEMLGGVQHYASDRVILVEAGVQTGDAFRTWRGEASVGAVDWRDIQADTISIGGDLMTENVGDGTIDFVQLKAVWAANDRLTVSGGVFINDSRVTLAGVGVIGVLGGRIPNVAPFGAQLSLAYGPFKAAGLTMTVAADNRYVGKSRPGLGVGLSTPQGGYVATDISAEIDIGRGRLRAKISNPFDIKATRFGLGSPYREFDSQGAPVRPRTISLGFEIRY